jgi:L-ascorbate metabolism protein UlaG (beta-lactamase superfamily)
VTAVTWLGHATVLVELDGTRVLTDPVLRRRIGHLVRQGDTPPVPDRLDAVLVSHLHHDHADRASLRMLPGGTEVIGPPGIARIAKGSREVVPGEEVTIGSGVRAIVTPAQHGGGRTPLKRSPPEALGFVLDGTARVYFAGDTDLFAEMEQIGARGLDIALLPIWGWGPRLPAGHLDPDSAAKATRLLAPRVVIPIHWGTYLRVGMKRADLDAPARAFTDAVARTAPSVEVAVLAPGETLVLETR